MVTPEAITAQFPIGTKVKYHPVIDEPAFVETKIRSEAWALGSGHIVIKVEGRAGGVSHKAIERIEDDGE